MSQRLGATGLLPLLFSPFPPLLLLLGHPSEPCSPTHTPSSPCAQRASQNDAEIEAIGGRYKHSSALIGRLLLAEAVPGTSDGLFHLSLFTTLQRGVLPSSPSTDEEPEARAVKRFVKGHSGTEGGAGIQTQTSPGCSFPVSLTSAVVLKLCGEGCGPPWDSRKEMTPPPETEHRAWCLEHLPRSCALS